MNAVSFIVYLAGFLALPPVLLTARAIDRAYMPWRLLLGVSTVGGWLLANLAYLFYINDLSLQMFVNGDAMNPKYPLMSFETVESSRNVFLLRFGWLFGPVYLLPWLFLYCACVFVRWWMAPPRAAAG